MVPFPDFRTYTNSQKMELSQVPTYKAERHSIGNMLNSIQQVWLNLIPENLSIRKYFGGI